MSLYIVGIGGATRPGSATEKALQCVLDAARAEGATVELIGAPSLTLPIYAPENPERTDAARHLVDAVRRADGLVIGSPGYHGTVSGLVKNALDYVEDTAKDPRPYFEGRAVGCVANAWGWQAAVQTLATLRTVVHSLRGWPTPLGIALNTSTPLFDAAGACTDPKIAAQLATVGQQIVRFAQQQKDG